MEMEPTRAWSPCWAVCCTSCMRCPWTAARRYVSSMLLLCHDHAMTMPVCRSQIRHCAMNTLFSAMAAHAGIISAQQWRLVFEDIIFCLFKKAGDRSAHAMR